MTGTHETRLNVNDHINVQQCGDDLQGFDTMWDDVLLSIQEVPSDSVLESLHRTQLTNFDQLRNVLAMYDMELLQHESKPSYQRSGTMVKNVLDQKSKARNFVARNERTATGAPAKSQGRGKPVGTERKQGECH